MALRQSVGECCVAAATGPLGRRPGLGTSRAVPALIAAMTISAALGMAIACGSGAKATKSSPSPAAEVGPLVLSDKGCAYQGPSQVAAGPVVIHMVDQTTLQFNLDLWRLDDAHTYADLDAHIKEEQRRSAAGEPGLGHPTFATLVDQTSVPGGATKDYVTTLIAGTYGFVCISFDTEPRGIWVAGPLGVTP